MKRTKMLGPKGTVRLIPITRRSDRSLNLIEAAHGGAMQAQRGFIYSPSSGTG